MKNNISIAGFSELVHEVRTEPSEAWFRYKTSASYKPGRGLGAEVLEATFGSVKSARRFNYLLHTPLGSPPSESRSASPVDADPVQLALTGIASCALTTLISGGGVRGVSFESVQLTMQLLQQQAGQGNPRLTVRCMLHCTSDAERDMIEDLVKQVMEFSPNTRTVIDPGKLEVSYQDEIVGTMAEYRRPTTGSPLIGECKVEWINGSQFYSYFLPEQNRSTLSPLPLRVDQPKQLTGIDWGPNPQEYLLMALAGDLVEQVVACSLSRGQSLPNVRVVTSAAEDMRGLLNAPESTEVRIQDVSASVEVFGEHELKEEDVTAALNNSVIAELLSGVHDVDFEIDTKTSSL